MQLTDFLDRYQIYYAIIRFIMNYQPINRFIGKKYKIKVPGGLSNRYQKVTFGTGWKVHPVP